MTKTAAQHLVADELDAMANELDVTDVQYSELSDLSLGVVLGRQRAVRTLRKRAAELRGDPDARYM